MTPERSREICQDFLKALDSSPRRGETLGVLHEWAVRISIVLDEDVEVCVARAVVLVAAREGKTVEEAINLICEKGPEVWY